MSYDSDHFARSRRDVAGAEPRLRTPRLPQARIRAQVVATAGAAHPLTLLVLFSLIAACGGAPDENATPTMDPTELPAPTQPAAPESEEPDPDSPDAPAAEIRAYYQAISNGDYPAAYLFWADSGRASGQTLEEFASGFADTGRVTATTGEAGRVEGAAGSRYVEIPVDIHAVLRDGTEQFFRGSYTLRRSVIDGATEAQREWKLFSAEIEQLR